MKGWLISVVSLLIVITLLELLIPKGRLSPLIGSVFSVVFMLVAFYPLIGKISLSDFSERFDYDSMIETDGDFLYYTAEKSAEIKKTKCLKKLNEYGINDLSFDIKYSKDDYGAYEIKSVTVFFDESVINGNTEHINIIEKISSVAKDFFGAVEIEVKSNVGQS